MSERPPHVIDYDYIARLLSRKRSRLKLSLRGVAKASGVPLATLSEFESRLRPTILPENMAKLCQWLDVPLQRVMLERLSGETLQQIVDVVRSDRTLSASGKEAVIKIFTVAYEQSTKSL